VIANDHQKLADFIWSIANKLRGPTMPNEPDDSKPVS